MTSRQLYYKGTPTHPDYHKILVANRGRDSSKITFFSYRENGCTVAGMNASIGVVVDKPAIKVWPYFANFNLWQNQYGYYYRDVEGKLGIHGELKGKTLRFEVKRGELNFAYDYMIDAVVPNRLIVKHEVPRDVEGVSYTGDHVFMLTDMGGTTMISMLMQHEQKASHKSADELLEGYFETMLPDGEQNDYLLDDLVYTLKKVVMSA